MKTDSLGDRMKGQYEGRAKQFLPRRTYTIVRLDGKAFHTYTRECERPWDEGLHASMVRGAAALCREMSGAVLAYTQSDEVSVLLTDFASNDTQAWFDGNVQKIVSVSAAKMTAVFNAERPAGLYGLGLFDSRCFTIPDPTEVCNYFVWRQQDATRNSISMAAQSLYSSRELHGKSGDEQQEMLWQKGVNWDDYPSAFKRGSVVYASRVLHAADQWNAQPYERREWRQEAAPVFARSAWLKCLVPVYE